MGPDEFSGAWIPQSIVTQREMIAVVLYQLSFALTKGNSQDVTSLPIFFMVVT